MVVSTALTPSLSVTLLERSIVPETVWEEDHVLVANANVNLDTLELIVL